MLTETSALLRQRLALDPQRPRYHFLPPSNWMNDPNGFIQWQGQWHLFYQHNPYSPLWGKMHWGHAVSSDLIHWSDLPLALTPTIGSADEAGCYSGCTVDNNGIPTIMYTGTRGAHNEIQTQCLASSHDGLLTWQKYVHNPVLSDVPPEAGQTQDFRDPFVWCEGDTWYMLLGSRIHNVGGAIFLYRSKNLIDWEYLHPLLIGDSKRNGIVWECPNFFKLSEDRWVLIVSAYTAEHINVVYYFVGSYAEQRFTVISEGILDYGQLYAPLTAVDDQDRRVLIGWLREARSNESMEAAGWSGVQSIPRVLSLDPENRLCMSPINLDSIRGRHHHLEAQAVDQRIPLELRGLALDIEAVFEQQALGCCGLALACTEDGSEYLSIFYDVPAQRLMVRYADQERKATVSLAPQERLQLRILLDGSVAEIIVNERISLSARLYPSSAGSHGVQIIGQGAYLHSLDIWEMASIWG
ncbi:MAG: glycoside hydrolase family 32 protein [Anaerolineae bacterium]